MRVTSTNAIMDSLTESEKAHLLLSNLEILYSRTTEEERLMLPFTAQEANEAFATNRACALFRGMDVVIDMICGGCVVRTQMYIESPADVMKDGFDKRDSLSILHASNQLEDYMHITKFDSVDLLTFYTIMCRRDRSIALAATKRMLDGLCAKKPPMFTSVCSWMPDSVKRLTCLYANYIVLGGSLDELSEITGVSLDDLTLVWSRAWKDFDRIAPLIAKAVSEKLSHRIPEWKY